MIDFNKINTLTSNDTKVLLKQLMPRMNKYMAHYPTPKQQVFMNLNCREAFFGGSTGGGKSDALLMDALQNVDVKGYSALLLRKSYSDLVKPGALIDRSKEWLLKYPEVKWNEKDKKFEWLASYGRKRDVISTLQFGYMETENDKYQFQGGEYQYCGFDELTHFAENNYKYLFSRMRKLKGMTIPLKIRAASNPPDEGQGIWVYDRFVNPKTKNKDVIFLPSGLNDNPFVDKDSYLDMLNELDPVTRARLRDGNWEIVRKGNMFKRDWFEFVDQPPMFRRKCRFWDMASTDDKVKKSKKDPDYTVGLLLSESNGIFYIEDIIRVRKTPDVTEKMQLTASKSDGFNVMIREEQEPGSSGEYTIMNKARSIFLGMDYKGEKSTGSKVDRANALSSAAERGQIKILKTCRYVDELFNELESFPVGALNGGHDDLVDALSGAYKALGSNPLTGIPTSIVSGDGSYWSKLEGDYSSSPFTGWRG